MILKRFWWPEWLWVCQGVGIKPGTMELDILEEDIILDQEVG